MKPLLPSDKPRDADFRLIDLQPISQDQKTLAERQWQAPTKAAKPQQPCDHGLFSDEADQLDIIEMLQDPTNGE